ncbi:ABC-2 type transport system ATP-binding protein/ATP-binding cassette, subfamily A (ABC1), member 2/ATP binding cassette, subfamily A (ABC1), member 13 [Pelagirhabdus alkalitolerans]|uniref:ABC-2 type transport system ATP-binding protein/ATP-binding cassette, subfamily A (ABC1), member 2/ATP binding cassette, subfamily A (ABC1), member 13 n=1 Tax=Pelagirhabdus alkalitolerans TaxID=1612202 RepID=A0A1G6M3U3_9BACI|nr:ABC transporter ATP-binding protein [Pelagirhabdus alkalitolerans]SDC50208.1 ABC-2 type transport system ATP-binding protein/ATP-binding cassette, subfamily A (ABC1), member 2/ATP binding cassette, subfamily A (ABC1), member 13 [Pelagirhabdus alkalitolerans]
MIKVNDLNYSIGGSPILKDLTFHVPKKALTVLIGPNGVGKTTTLELLSGVRKINNDSVESIIKKHRILYLDMELLIFEELTTKEYVDLIADINNLNTQDIKVTLRDFEPMNLEDFYHVRIGGLSLGQKQKLTLFTGFLTKPDVLLFDEPFNALDYKSQNHLKNLFNEYKKDITFLITTHSLDNLEEYVDSCILLFEGRIEKQTYNNGGVSYGINYVIEKYKQT